mgnify:CR=1 FL=1
MKSVFSIEGFLITIMILVVSLPFVLIADDISKNRKKIDSRPLVEQYDDLNCESCGDRVLMVTDYHYSNTLAYAHGPRLASQGSLAVISNKLALQVCSYHIWAERIKENNCTHVISLPANRVLSDQNTFKVREGVLIRLVRNFKYSSGRGGNYSAWFTGAQIAITIPEQNGLHAYTKSCNIFFGEEYESSSCTDVYPRTS